MTHQMKPGVMVLKQTRTQGRVKVGVGNVHTLGQARWEDFIVFTSRVFVLYVHSLV